MDIQTQVWEMLAKMTDVYGWETVWQSTPKTVKNNKELIGMLVISDGANVEVIQVWFNIMTGVTFVHNGDTYPVSKRGEMMECVDFNLKLAAENDEKKNADAEKKSTDVESVDVEKITPVAEKVSPVVENIEDPIAENLQFFEDHWENHGGYYVIYGCDTNKSRPRYIFHNDNGRIHVTPTGNGFIIRNIRANIKDLAVCNREDVMTYINSL